MQTSKIAAAAMALAMGLGNLAYAQPRDRHDDPRGGPPHGQWERGGPDRGGPPRGGHRGPGGPRGPGFDPHGRDGGYRDARGAGPDHRFHRGDRLPSEYRSRQYVVNDWRGHRLSAPPRGYQWVQVGGDYVLAAVATGIIASLFLSQQ